MEPPAELELPALCEQKVLHKFDRTSVGTMAAIEYALSARRGSRNQNDQSDHGALAICLVDKRVGGAHRGKAARIENLDRLAIDPYA